MRANLVIDGIVLLGLLFLGIVLWIKFSQKDVRSGGDSVYELWKTILTPAEQRFATALEGSLPDEVRLLAKVRLGDVFYTKKDLGASQRASARNRINQKHVDFLLVRARDFAPLVGIELDDRSHDREDRSERDRFVDRIFASGNLPLLHVRAASTYQTSDLRAQIEAVMVSDHHHT
jgi:hypothetical protein